jgi:hypothetical protein
MKVNTMPTGLHDLEGLRTARLVLTNLRGALQIAKDAHDLVKAQAEARAIELLNGSAGRNEDERKRNLVIALGADPEYRQALRGLRDAETAVGRAETDLDLALDQRRAEEWGVRLSLVAALDRLGIPSNTPGSDESFDEVADEVVSEYSAYQAKREAHAAHIDQQRAYREMDEVFGVSF